MATRRGFTLVEMLVVIGVIVILSAILIPAAFGMSRQASKTATKSIMRQVEAMAKAFKNDNGTFPLVRDSTYGKNFKYSTSSRNASIENNQILVDALDKNDYLTKSGSGKTSLAVERYDDPHPDTGGEQTVSTTGGTNYLANRVFVDNWGRPLIYIFQVTDSSDFTNGWLNNSNERTKARVTAMTTPKVANSPKGNNKASTTIKGNWRRNFDDNAFGRGSKNKAFAPAWPGMRDGGSDTEAAQRRRLSEYCELWSAGPDGRFDFNPDFNTEGNLGTPTNGMFYHKKVEFTDSNKKKHYYNNDNFTISAPWQDDSAAMPWEE